MNPPPTETFRDFLDRREDELAERVYTLRTELGPLEIELAEIRRARASLGLASISRVDQLARGPDHEKGQNGTNQLLQRAAQDDIAPDEMTIKELIVRALRDHPGGAMPAQIGEYISKAFNRNIDPGSLRPNLARLREAGVVEHDGLASKWILAPTAVAALHVLFEESPLMKRARELAWDEDKKTLSSS